MHIECQFEARLVRRYLVGGRCVLPGAGTVLSCYERAGTISPIKILHPPLPHGKVGWWRAVSCCYTKQRLKHYLRMGRHRLCMAAIRFPPIVPS